MNRWLDDFPGNMEENVSSTVCHYLAKKYENKLILGPVGTSFNFSYHLHSIKLASMRIGVILPIS